MRNEEATNELNLLLQYTVKSQEQHHKEQHFIGKQIVKWDWRGPGIFWRSNDQDYKPLAKPCTLYEPQLPHSIKQSKLDSQQFHKSLIGSKINQKEQTKITRIINNLLVKYNNNRNIGRYNSSLQLLPMLSSPLLMAKNENLSYLTFQTNQRNEMMKNSNRTQEHK